MSNEDDVPEKDELYSQRVRAGKRTYFFDVKSTRGNDYFLTITESKRVPREDGFTYEKHKIFLYKEDFLKFAEALQDAISHVRNELLTEEESAALEHQNRAAIGDDGLKWE